MLFRSLAEVIRPLHGGGVHSTLDLQMKNLRYRTGPVAVKYGGLPTPFVEARYPVRSAVPAWVSSDVEESLS